MPAGSMHRTVDVVVRNEMVERVKAGDWVSLAGSLVVVPDGSALARAGEAVRAISSNDGRNKGGGGRGGGEEATGGGGGVRGLAALGVKELTYRTCFVACAALPSDVAERVRRKDGEGVGTAVGVGVWVWFLVIVVVAVVTASASTTAISSAAATALRRHELISSPAKVRFEPHVLPLHGLGQIGIVRPQVPMIHEQRARKGRSSRSRCTSISRCYYGRG